MLKRCLVPNKQQSKNGGVTVCVVAAVASVVGTSIFYTLVAMCGNSAQN